MAQAMQGMKSKIAAAKSVAERHFYEILSGVLIPNKKPEQKDAALEACARTWHDEIILRECGNLHLTEKFSSFSAEWSIDRLGEVSFELYPDTYRYLCVRISHAWISYAKDRTRFGQTLRGLPLAAGKIVASAIRSVLDARYGNNKPPEEVIMLLAQFFVGAEAPTGENDVFRQIGKSLAKYAKMEDLIWVGQLLYVLTDSKYNVGVHDRRPIVTEPIASQIALVG